MPKEKGQRTDPGASNSGQTNSSALGGASERTQTEEVDSSSAKESERREGRGIGHGRGERNDQGRSS